MANNAVHHARCGYPLLSGETSCIQRDGHTGPHYAGGSILPARKATVSDWPHWEWKVELDSPAVVQGKGAPIAYVNTFLPRDQTARIARLMARAPELVGILEAIADSDSRWSAIAKDAVRGLA